MISNNKESKGLDLEKSLKKDKLVLSITNGKSMYPFLNDGTRIILSKTKTYNMLDSVLFKINGRYELHRIIGLSKNKVIVCGDNNLVNECINKKDILGVLIGYYKRNKYVEINDAINQRYFKISRYNKCMIRLKNKIKSMLA